MEEDDIKELREHLETAHLVILEQLSELFGSHKRAPDDHPLWKAVEALEKAQGLLPSVGEDEDETAATAAGAMRSGVEDEP
jgi:hypothetical protein